MFVQLRPQSQTTVLAMVAYCTDFPAELSRISLQLSTYIGEMADGNEIVADLEKEGESAGVGRQ